MYVYMQDTKEQVRGADVRTLFRLVACWCCLPKRKKKKTPLTQEVTAS